WYESLQNAIDERECSALAYSLIQHPSGKPPSSSLLRRPLLRVTCRLTRIVRLPTRQRWVKIKAFRLAALTNPRHPKTKRKKSSSHRNRTPRPATRPGSSTCQPNLLPNRKLRALRSLPSVERQVPVV